MAEIVLYHHAQGLTKGVEAFADELRRAGHTVHVPDLYEGQTFDTLDEGLAYAKRTGFGTINDRGITAVEGLGDALVYAGFSLGGMPAQQLAQTRAGASGALLFHSCVPVSEFGEAWPAGVPVQVHGMEADPFFAEEGGDLDAARALVDSTERAELFLIPARSICSPTRHCRRTTRLRPPCSRAGCSTSSMGSGENRQDGSRAPARPSCAAVQCSS